MCVRCQRWNTTLRRRDRRYRTAAISVAAKRLGLGAGAKRFVSDSPYLSERSALRGAKRVVRRRPQAKALREAVAKRRPPQYEPLAGTVWRDAARANNQCKKTVGTQCPPYG